MKTTGYYLEQTFVFGFGVGIAAINHCFPLLINCAQSKEIVSKIIDISFINFGFFLTLLALLIQSSARLKVRKLYDRLIKLILHILGLSVISGLFSFVLISFYHNGNIDKSYNYLFTGLFLLMGILISKSILYIKVFYNLAIDREL
jgi:hypothetical protein